MKILTDFVYPPIPSRSTDWAAYTDNYDGAPDAGPQLIGWGSTEEEALAELRAQIEEREIEHEDERYESDDSRFGVVGLFRNSHLP